MGGLQKLVRCLIDKGVINYGSMTYGDKSVYIVMWVVDKCHTKGKFFEVKMTLI